MTYFVTAALEKGDAPHWPMATHLLLESCGGPESMDRSLVGFV